MTLNREFDKIVVKIIPKTFDLSKLNKGKVEKLDIFFQIIAQDIREEEEEYKLNH